MTKINKEHRQLITENFRVIEERPNAIFFEAYGDLICEINDRTFYCESVEEFHELVEMFGDDPMEV